MDKYQKILKELYKAKIFGYTKLENGTELIGNVPHVAPLARLHLIFPPLSEGKILDLQNEFNIRFNDDFKKFLTMTNGISLFSGSIDVYGKRRNYKRTGDDIWQPFDLDIPNVHERPKDAKENYLFIGGYKWDGSLLYIDIKTSKVYRCPSNTTKPLNEWISFWGMLESEVIRLSKMFDEKGKQIHPDEPTTPPQTIK